MPADAPITPTDAPMRMFVALPLPEPIVNQIADLSTRLRKAVAFTGCRTRWVHPGAFHLTLAFLGDRPASLATRIAERLEALSAGFSPQRLEIKHLGVFPHWSRPRVLWVGIRDRTHQLAELHARVNAALQDFDYTPESNAFRPHITLTRFKSFRDIAAVETLARQHDDFRFGPFFADELVLFRSRLSPDGARHERLSAHRLSITPISNDRNPDSTDEESDHAHATRNPPAAG
jgi:2'-5' RNA ligase